MNNKSKKALIAAMLVATNLAATKLPTASAESQGRPMVTESQLNIDNYSPEVIRMYNNYLLATDIANQFSVPYNPNITVDLEVVKQADNLMNMNFPFEDGIPEEEVLEKTINLMNYMDLMVGYAINYGIEGIGFSENTRDPEQKQFLQYVENLAQRFRQDPRNKEIWDEVFKLTRSTNRYPYSPSVEFVITSTLAHLIGKIDDNYIYDEKNTDILVPLTGYEIKEIDLKGQQQLVLFIPEDPEGLNFTQWSYNPYVVDETGAPKYEGKIYSEEQLIEMGATQGGLIFEFEQAFVAARQGVQKIIQLNAIYDTNEKTR